jgi:hypothetical protein
MEPDVEALVRRVHGSGVMTVAYATGGGSQVLCSVCAAQHPTSHHSNCSLRYLQASRALLHAGQAGC